MREIVLDTETTGFDPETGDRIVEIGAVELMRHLPTANHFHVYLNPERTMPEGAFAVHGLGDEFLRDKPLFAAVADDFLAFIGDARLVIHNASFDMKFLNAELTRAGRSPLAADRAIDTVLLARRKFPGSPASLDALCRRFGVDLGGRDLHGALLDSRLLAEVYLELIGGRQPDFGLGSEPAGEARQTRDASASEADAGWRPRPRPMPLPPRITAEETAAHQAFVEALGPAAIWRRG